MAENNKPEKPVSIQTVSKEQEQLEALIRHIKKVQDACWELAKKLLKRGEISFARQLVAASLTHDNSKFYGIEWENLIHSDNQELLKFAVHHHTQTNKHHPEYWGGVDNMPRVSLAEMVCDWYARSNEFATDLRAWVKDTALEKYDISPQGKTYKIIKEFIDLLLEPPFTQIK